MKKEAKNLEAFKEIFGSGKAFTKTARIYRFMRRHALAWPQFRSILRYFCESFGLTMISP